MKRRIYKEIYFRYNSLYKEERTMNRGFRKKYMRLTALLLSVAVVSGSMDINMLQVQAAQEQSTVAEETVSGGMDPTELTDAADPQEDAEQGKESEPQDTISAGNDEEQYENPAINDGENSAGSQDGAQSDADAGLQEDEKPEDTERMVQIPVMLRTGRRNRMRILFQRIM
jgi:hypothetical protein